MNADLALPAFAGAGLAREVPGHQQAGRRHANPLARHGPLVAAYLPELHPG